MLRQCHSGYLHHVSQTSKTTFDNNRLKNLIFFVAERLFANKLTLIRIKITNYNAQA